MDSFILPTLQDNPDGWGPSTDFKLPGFEDIQYTPFNKNDKLGRVCDFSISAHKGKDGRFRDAPVEEEEAFHLVDNRPVPRSRFNKFQDRRNRGPWQNRQRDGQQNNQNNQNNQNRRQNMHQNRSHQHQHQRPGMNKFENRQRTYREASVDVKADWTIVDEYQFSLLSKLSFDAPEPQDLTTAGSLDNYDKSVERITAKAAVPLARAENLAFFNVTTTDDPIIQQLASENVGNVFATDHILACLMAAPRSVYSWDLIVQRVGNSLFFDKRDGSQFDFLTVNETAQETPSADDKDSVNSAQRLSQEATFINQNFSQMVLGKDQARTPMANPNPFADSDAEAASVGYRYRKWQLSEDITLVARCEVDAVVKTGEDSSYVSIKALNEYDPRITGDWRSKLDSQRGAVLASELKNNSCKLAKWTAQALISGSEMIKLGFVSRVHSRDPYNHVVLNTISYKTRDFASQINLNVSNGWGILKGLIEVCMGLPEGKYLFLKDPNKSILRLYEIPADTFEDDEA
eukprot:GILI01001678.1.p1 GENE.GILI01001678.1~~GILI01001678.1.p1  ORF type:complete len:516 (+),score=163.15 GILI01001678.1:234-1781(+)